MQWFNQCIAVQELVALASAKEGALQAIQEMEDAKLRLAEQKMARLARVEGAMQAQLRAAGAALDEHAGDCCSYLCAARDTVLCRTGRCVPIPAATAASCIWCSWVSMQVGASWGVVVQPCVGYAAGRRGRTAPSRPSCEMLRVL